MTISASLPYTCGELFQGTLDGQACLVSCPIGIYSTALIVPKLAGQTLPRKAGRALEQLPLAGTEIPSISLLRRLPSGRGYGTSTADIGGVIFAAARFAGLSISSIQASRQAVAIEPTDSTFFPGLALFDHRQAEFHQILGAAAPPAVVAILDPGGVVDSEAFNACNWNPALAKLAGQHRQAFDLLQSGIAAQDLSAIGEASTLSAQAHQKILFNPLLDQALALARETGAVGICRAHSGTILGLLFSKPSFDEQAIVLRLRKQLPAQIHLRLTELTVGGPRFANLSHSFKEPYHEHAIQ